MVLEESMTSKSTPSWFNPLVTRRPLRLFEFCDLDFTPSWIVSNCQTILTEEWSSRLPILQPTSPAYLAASIISSALAKLDSESSSSAEALPPISIIDPCAGAGGPTPTIERIINQHRSPPIQFTLADIHPHLPAWSAAAKKSSNLDYISESVDASAPSKSSSGSSVSSAKTRVLRLFALSFHHLPDSLAAAVLESTLESSHGFCVFELQDRRIASLLLTAVGQFLLVLATGWWWISREREWNWRRVLGTYGVPVLPFVMAFDGVVSSLRTREFEEVVELIRGGEWLVEEVKSENGMRKAVVRKGDVIWTLEGGRRMHTWPIGFANWIVGVRSDGKE